MGNNANQLDALDVKFFEEMPFLIDVFSSSLLKLSTLFSSQFDMIRQIANDFLCNKSDWKISIKSYKNNFYPFTSFEPLKPKIKSISNLSAEFTIDNNIFFERESNYFNIAFGFEGTSEKVQVYYGIYRYDVGKATNPRSFYDDLEKKLRDYSLEIKLPSMWK